MRYESATLTYRRAVTEQASPIGLVIALYDTLASDLQRAAAAMRRVERNAWELGAIQERSDHLKHALQVLGQLNALLDLPNGGTCAENLARFYEHLRQSILACQFQKNATILELEVSRILQVRTAWQQVDSRLITPDASLDKADGVSGGPQDSSNRDQPFSCSA